MLLEATPARPWATPRAGVFWSFAPRRDEARGELGAQFDSHGRHHIAPPLCAEGRGPCQRKARQVYLLFPGYSVMEDTFAWLAGLCTLQQAGTGPSPRAAQQRRLLPPPRGGRVPVPAAGPLGPGQNRGQTRRKWARKNSRKSA